MSDAIYVPPTAPIQTETVSYLARVSAAGGNLDAATVAALDKFIVQGKQDGWWSAVKQCWVPVGDFAASKVFLVTPSGVTPAFNNFAAADYSQATGYALSSNSNKYVNTGFIPNSNGVTSTNLLLGAVSLDDRPAGANAFAYMVGCTPPLGTTVPNPMMDWANSAMGVSGGLTHPYAGEATVMLGHYGASASGSVNNGAVGVSGAAAGTVAFDSAMTLFRSQRENSTTYYATGAVGFYVMGTDASNALCVLMSRAVERLMIDVGRDVYRRPTSIIPFGDSITQGTGATAGYSQVRRWGKLLATALGAREKNTGQGSSITATTQAGIVGGLQRYSTLADGQPGIIPMVYGTNDIGNDSTTTPTTSLVNGYQAALSSIIAGFQSANHKVIVGGPPYRTGWASAVQVAYQAAAAAAAKANKVPFADLYNAFLDNGGAALLADGTHPNDTGHALIAEYMLYASRGRMVRKPTLDFGSIAAGASADLTVTVYNAVAGQSVSLGLPSTIESGLTFNAFVSANDTVTVRATNATGSAIDPASQQFCATVFTAN